MSDDNKGNPPANPQGNGDDNKGNPPAGNPPEGFIPKESYDAVAAELRKKNAELAKIAEAEDSRKKKELEEQGKWKEAAEAAQKERDTYKQKHELSVRANAVKVAALQAGVVNPDDLVALINVSEVKLSEDGSIDQASVNEIVKKAKEAKPYLFGAKPNPQNANVGNGGNPGGSQPGDKPRYKRSQVANSEFYKAHEKEILEAMREGRIDDDVQS